MFLPIVQIFISPPKRAMSAIQRARRMGCGTSAPSRSTQPFAVGPPSTVPHHPETDPSDLYRVVSKRPERIKAVSPRTQNNANQTKEAPTPTDVANLRSPQSSELPSFEAVDVSRKPVESPDGAPSAKLRSLDSDMEHIWDASTSASTNLGRLPRHTLASLLRSVFDYLPPTYRTLTVEDCEDALGKAFRQYPAFMPEDENGNIASPPRTGTHEENAKKDMRAWIMATSFDRPTTPIGHCVKEPSDLSKALTGTYLHLKARINDHMHTDEDPPSKGKKGSSSGDGPAREKPSPRAVISPRAGSTPIASRAGEHSLQLSPTRPRKQTGSPAHEATTSSFLDRDTIRISHDITLEECEPSDQASMGVSVSGASVSPSTAGLMDTVSHGAVSSSTGGRPHSPTRTLKSIQAYRAMRDVGLSRNKKRLAERVSSWIELGLLTIFEDPTNAASPQTQVTRAIAQTAAPLSSANLATLQSQLHALRSRAAATTLHPSPDNEDFFMNVPSAICWYYGAGPFHPDPNCAPSSLTQILPPCVLRFPYNNVYGFAIARNADMTRRAVQKLSAIAHKEHEPSVII